jgi:hypothetical protein
VCLHDLAGLAQGGGGLGDIAGDTR